MSGHPYIYGRGMAIAKLMQDMRRPVLKEIIRKNKERYDELCKSRDESKLDYHVFGPHGPQTVYLHGEDLYVSRSDTIDWVPKLEKLTRYGRWSSMILKDKPEVEGKPYIQWGDMVIKPIEGWPTEAEIAAEIAESSEREKKWRESVAKDPGYLGLSLNDFDAMKRTIG